MPNIIKPFTSTGTSTWTVPHGLTTCDVIVVGGGGGGGGGCGGAGGAFNGTPGQVATGSFARPGGVGQATVVRGVKLVPGQTATIVVGKGGFGGAGGMSGSAGITTGSNGQSGQNGFDGVAGVSSSFAFDSMLIAVAGGSKGIGAISQSIGGIADTAMSATASVGLNGPHQFQDLSSDDTGAIELYGKYVRLLSYTGGNSGSAGAFGSGSVRAGAGGNGTSMQEVIVPLYVSGSNAIPTGSRGGNGGSYANNTGSAATVGETGARGSRYGMGGLAGASGGNGAGGGAGRPGSNGARGGDGGQGADGAIIVLYNQF